MFNTKSKRSYDSKHIVENVLCSEHNFGIRSLCGWQCLEVYVIWSYNVSPKYLVINVILSKGIHKPHGESCQHGWHKVIFCHFVYIEEARELYCLFLYLVAPSLFSFKYRMFGF